jgi:hypothetical protein
MLDLFIVALIFVVIILAAMYHENRNRKRKRAEWRRFLDREFPPDGRYHRRD